jgi:phytoene/squalene synthetase
VCNNHPLTNVYFNRIIETRVFEVNNKEVATMDQLFKLAEGVRTSLILLSLELLRVPITKEIEEVAVEAGRAIGVCEYIKRVPYNLRTYRLYLPDEITKKHNVSVRNLWDRIHGQPREQYLLRLFRLFDVVLEVAAYARECLLRAKKLQGVLPP